VSEIVARFQATAGARALQTTEGATPMDIASAARAHLEGRPSDGLRTVAMKSFSGAEQAELINEGRDRRARNFDALQIAGTHYSDLEAALAREVSLTDPDELFI
jgi:hypothetical protein